MAATTPLDEEEVIVKFRNRLNEFKRPYIEMTDQPSKQVGQTMDTLDSVFDNIYRLYMFLRPIIEQGGVIPSTIEPTTEDATVLQVFEQDGILNALRADPSLKAPLLRYLTLDLYTYPYTLRPGHITVLDAKAIESHQNELVGNNRDE